MRLHDRATGRRPGARCSRLTDCEGPARSSLLGGAYCLPTLKQPAKYANRHVVTARSLPTTYGPRLLEQCAVR